MGMRILAQGLKNLSAVFLISIVLLPLQGMGDPAQPEPAPAAAPEDFGAGFGMFYQLGLPQVQDAQYVKLDIHTGSRSHTYSYWEHQVKLSGNAWLLGKNEDGSHRFLRNNMEIVDVFNHQELMKLRMEEQKAEAEKAKGQQRQHFGFHHDPKGRNGGTWQNADASKDIASIISFINKMKAADGVQRHMLDQFKGEMGTIFLTCVHYYANNLKTEANQLAAALFEFSGDRRGLINEAVGKLAGGLYGVALNRFYRDRDWHALSTELQTLLGKFAKNWWEAPAVNLLLEKIRLRANETAPPALPEEFKAADRELALALANLDDQALQETVNMGHMHGSWVLQGRLRPRPGMPKLARDSIFARLFSRGLEAMPLLLALADDEYLTFADNSTIGGMTTHYGYGSRSRMRMTGEMIRQVYLSMRRPATRGDLVFQLLRTVPVQTDNQQWWSRDKHHELVETCRQFYEDYKDKPGIELAKAYLRSINGPQRQAAIQYITHNGSEDDIRDLEESMLKPGFLEADGMGFHIIQQYVSARQEKAKAFVEKLAAIVEQPQPEATAETTENPEEQMFKRSGRSNLTRIKAQLPSLRSMVDMEPAADMLAAVVSGKKELQEINWGLLRALGRETTDQALTLLLNAALETSDPNTARSFLQTAMQVKSLKAYANPQFTDTMDDEGGDDAEPEIPQELNITTHAELWLKLLQRADEKAGGADSHDRHFRSIPDTAAWNIEFLYGNQEQQRHIHSVVSQMGEDGRRLFRERAAARLAGKDDAELPKFPDADNVSAEQFAVILNKFRAAAAADIPALVKGLSIDERLAFQKQKIEDPELNRKLLAPAHLIKEIEINGFPDAEKHEVNSFKGMILDQQMLENLIGICEAEARAGNYTSVLIERSPGFQGLRLRLRRTSKDNDNFQAEQKRFAYYRNIFKDNPGITSMVSGGTSDLSASANWTVEKDSAAAKTADDKDKLKKADEIDDDLSAMMNEMSMSILGMREGQREKFHEIAGQFIGGAGNIAGLGRIQIQGFPVIPEGKDK